MMGKGGFALGALVALGLAGAFGGDERPRSTGKAPLVSQKPGKPTSNRKARLLAAALKRKERKTDV